MPMRESELDAHMSKFARDHVNARIVDHKSRTTGAQEPDERTAHRVVALLLREFMFAWDEVRKEEDRFREEQEKEERAEEDRLRSEERYREERESARGGRDTDIEEGNRG